MSRLSRLVIVAFLFVFALRVPLLSAPRWPQDESNLKPDAAATFGTLPNAIRYVILPNKEPKDRVSLRLLVLAGSLEETEEQRGLAHFLEHMAFNGSTHYAPGTLVEFFQRMGMSFGGDTNAYTSFDHTLYQIELPDTKTASLSEGLRVFSDFAGGLLLEPAQIEKERGIILSEKRTRDSVQFRSFVAEYEFLLPETLLPKRLPIGLSEVIEQSKRERFADFYNTWYRPERTVVVVVGDIKAADVEPLIKENFSSIKDRTEARPDPVLGRIPDAKGLVAGYHHEPEAPNTTVAIQLVVPQGHIADTAENRIKIVPRSLALQMLSRRLQILSKKEGSPFSTGSASASESYDLYKNASVELVCRADQWKAALAVGEQELRRALQYGFQAGELKEAVDGEINSLEQALKSASTRRSDELAEEITQGIVKSEVFTTPAADLALFKPAFEKATLEQCQDALRELWLPNQRYLFVNGNADLAPNKAEEEIKQTFEASRAVKVITPEKIANDEFAYTTFGKPGEIAKRDHIEDLDLDLVKFSNDVRVNLKRTDFEANTIHVLVRFGAGRLTEPAGQPGLGLMANFLFSPGGLGKHSIDDLQRILASKTVGINFSIHDDAFVLAGSTNREDLLMQMQLLAAYVTDPGFRPEAMRQAQKNIEQIYLRLAHTPDGPLKTDVPYRLASGDPRFGLPSKEVLQSRTVDEVRTWLAPALTSGPIEIAIVGDIDPSATLDAVAQTFGALPKRAPKPAYKEARQVFFPATPFDRTYTVPTEIPKGLVSFYWPTTDSRDVQRTRRLNILAEILTDRLRKKIREEKGGAYSPFAGSAPSDTYENYGYMVSQLTVDPIRAGEISDAVIALAADIQKNGVTADELERAKSPILTALRESARTNQYWLGSVLASAQEFPQHLDWCRTRYSDNEAITKADIDALAKTYLAPDKAFKVTVLPEKTDKPGQ